MVRTRKIAIYLLLPCAVVAATAGYEYRIGFPRTIAGHRVHSSHGVGQYSLVFNCGELINAAIDPTSGQLAPIPDAGKRACVGPSATSTNGTVK